jgi:membrane-associated phospholipid phosphatase
MNIEAPSRKQRTPITAWAFLFIPAIIWVFDVSLQKDIVWFRWVNQNAGYFPDSFWTGISLLGNGWACFALAFPLILFAPRLLLAGICSGIFTGIFSRLGKMIADTPRPAGLLDPSSFHIVENPLLHSAMPSGHTMTAFGIATAIYFSIDIDRRKNYLWIFLLAIAVGVSRMAVGAHWPEDVLIGASLGTLCGIAGAWLASKIKSEKLQFGQWPFWLSLVGSWICAYILLNTKLDYDLNKPFQYALLAVIILTWIGIVMRIKKS